MRSRCHVVARIGLLLFAASNAGALGQTLTLNLAKLKPGETLKESVPPGRSYSVQITNRIPGKQYSYIALVHIKAIPPLSLDVFKSAEDTRRTASCDAIDAATSELKDASAETVVPARRKALLKALAGSTDGCQLEIAAARLTLAECDVMLDTQVDLAAGQFLEVTVTRTADDGTALTWKAVFDAGDRGQWLTTYGFTFMPSDDAEYFSKPGTGVDVGKFIITRKAERRRYDFAPSVFFNWYPQWPATADLNIGPVAGLGFDFSAPVVFAGLSLLYNQNIGLVGGGVVHQVRRLAGEFAPDQRLGENLESGRLTEETYRLGYFLGLTFRFGSRPVGFGSTKKASAEVSPETENAPTPVVTLPEEPEPPPETTGTRTPSITATATRTPRPTTTPTPPPTPSRIPTPRRG